MKRIVALLLLAPLLALSCYKTDAPAPRGQGDPTQPWDPWSPPSDVGPQRLGASLIYPGASPFSGRSLGQSAALLAPSVSSQGLVAETFSRTMVINSTAPGAVSGTLQCAIANLYQGTSITNLSIAISVVGTALTLAKLGVYSSAGVRLAATADMSAAFNAAIGTKTSAVTGGPISAPSTGGYYFCVLQVGATPAAYAHGSSGASMSIYSAIGTGVLPAPIQSGLADLPGTATLVAPGTVAPDVGRAPWIGAS